MEVHNIEPVIDSKSKILILGSFPSVKSREIGFYYGHSKNRFYQVLSIIYGKDITKFSIDEKRKFLLSKGIAIFDVIKSCKIQGSQDSSISNVVPNDIPTLIKGTQIRKIYANGKTASKLLSRYYPQLSFIALPSTSPANAKFNLEKLVEAWKIIKE